MAESIVTQMMAGKNQGQVRTGGKEGGGDRAVL